MKIYLGLELSHCLNLDTTELTWAGSLLYYPTSEQRSYELLNTTEIMTWQEVFTPDLLVEAPTPAVLATLQRGLQLTPLINRLEMDFYALMAKITTRALSLSEQEGRDFQRRTGFEAPKETSPNLLTVCLELKIELGRTVAPRIDSCGLILLDAGRHYPAYLYQKKINVSPAPDRLISDPEAATDELIETLREIFRPSIQKQFAQIFDLQNGRLRV